MAKLKHKCEECDSIFTITYSEDNCEDDPHFCPFCAEYIIREDIEEDDE